MFERAHLQRLNSRIHEQRRFIQVVMGPRQVGKTTLIRQLLQKVKMESHFASADAVPGTTALWLNQQWEAARIRMDRDQQNEYLLVIDEIQKIGNWSETVKLLWDEDTMKGRDLRVILLGSSRLLLQKGLTESLAGRFELTYMGHWSFSEMHNAFGWNPDQFAWFGGYPGSATLIEDENRWKSYVREALIETSISKDILMLTRVDKPALMKQLFDIGCQYSGQILSYNKMLGQLQDAGNATTLAHYLQLLDTAGLLAGLSKYSRNMVYKKLSSPKLAVHNTALISAQSSESFHEVRLQPEKWGRIIESAIGAHLINQVLTSGIKLYYWREGNDEVDFIIENNKLTAIEVKSGISGQLSGMAAFSKKFTPDKVILVSSGGLSWQEFLSIDGMEILT